MQLCAHLSLRLDQHMRRCFTCMHESTMVESMLRRSSKVVGQRSVPQACEVGEATTTSVPQRTMDCQGLYCIGQQSHWKRPHCRIGGGWLREGGEGQTNSENRPVRVCRHDHLIHRQSQHTQLYSGAVDAWDDLYHIRPAHGFEAKFHKRKKKGENAIPCFEQLWLRRINSKTVSSPSMVCE